MNKNSLLRLTEMLACSILHSPIWKSPKFDVDEETFGHSNLNLAMESIKALVTACNVGAGSTGLGERGIKGNLEVFVKLSGQMLLNMSMSEAEKEFRDYCYASLMTFLVKFVVSCTEHLSLKVFETFLPFTLLRGS